MKMSELKFSIARLASAACCPAEPHLPPRLGASAQVGPQHRRVALMLGGGGWPGEGLGALELGRSQACPGPTVWLQPADDVGSLPGRVSLGHTVAWGTWSVIPVVRKVGWAALPARLVRTASRPPGPESREKSREVGAWGSVGGGRVCTCVRVNEGAGMPLAPACGYLYTQCSHTCLTC